MHKFTFQNWLDEKVVIEDLTSIVSNEQEYAKYDVEQLFEDYQMIRKEQNKAFIKHLRDLFEIRKRTFKSFYNNSLLRDERLNNTITSLESTLHKIRTGKKEIYEKALQKQDGRDELTSAQVKKYMSDDIDKINHTEWTRILIKYFFLGEPSDKYITPLTFIVNSNFLQWLYWFKEQQSLDKTEPTINSDLSSADEDIVEQANELFKKRVISYEWQGDRNEINLLYSQLLKGGFIPDSTDADNFMAMFSAKPLNSIQPMEWLRYNNLLAYLIDQLIVMDKFPDGTNYWSIAEACFVNTKNLKQARANYLENKQSKPRGYSKIDIILKTIEQFTNTLPVTTQ